MFCNTRIRLGGAWSQFPIVVDKNSTGAGSCEPGSINAISDHHLPRACSLSTRIQIPRQSLKTRIRVLSWPGIRVSRATRVPKKIANYEYCYW